MVDARATAVTETMTENGPSTRANIRVLGCNCVVLIVLPPDIGDALRPLPQSEHVITASHQGPKSRAFGTFVNPARPAPARRTGTGGR
ncbi:hypothetical protein MSHI_09640 [Mycobacterium shinjukuense]|uniref:Uncharacterized protein n=1 Tax=Mycobacterium shinjukuense TaxID=398694 RepID=A0A7I7MLD5_9MYCO|nr:hypothetical protein MSHI_09640 [Mycobacterium shinjukuense]